MNSRSKFPAVLAPAPSPPVLHVSAGETLAQTAERAAETMNALQDGRPVEPYFGVSSSEVGQLLGTFTARRWELIAEAGTARLARQAVEVSEKYYDDGL